LLEHSEPSLGLILLVCLVEFRIHLRSLLWFCLSVTPQA
jgi:hypothetical protein